MIVVVQSIGQIGNRLEQFSHLIAFCREHGHRLVNPAFSLYSEFFEDTHRDLLCRYPPRPSPWGGKALQRLAYYALRGAAALKLLHLVPCSAWVDHPWDADAYDLDQPFFVELARRKKIIFLTGAWKHRAWANYEAHLGATRHHFRLIPELRARVLRHFAPIRAAGDVVVGAHIRQGDNATDPVRRDCFPSEAYAKVMRKIVALFPGKRVVFLVCSNQSQPESLFEGMTIFRGPGEFIEDMYILAECDYLFGAGQSSFSAWASMMGQKPRLGLFDPDAPICLGDFKVCKGLE